MAVSIDQYDLRPATGQTDQRLTVDNSTGGVQLTKYVEHVTHVVYSVENAQVRYTIDGSAPTASNGHILEAGDWGIWPLSWADAAKFIRTGSKSGVIHVSPLCEAGAA